jgi:hypothetical protein
LWGCNGAPTPQILDAQIGTAVRGGEIVGAKSQFAPNERMVHLVVKVQNISAGVPLGAKWYALNEDGTRRLLYESDLNTDAFNTTAQFAITNSNDWQPGNYQVVIYLNGKEERRVNFQVIP